MRCNNGRGLARGSRLQAGVLALLFITGVAGLAARPHPASAQDGVGIPDSLTVLVGGLDTRTPDQPENTDVLMVVRVDFVAQSIRVINIPRDLYVSIPGFGYDKITRAYDYGSKAQGGDQQAGMDQMKATFTENFGVEIDAVLLTTFEGFQRIIDAVGGVDVDNPYDVYDAEYPTPDYGTKEIYYPAGPLHLDGGQALEFCRTRHQDGDDGRVMRQQLVLRAVLDKIHDPELLPQLPDLLRETADAVRTDLSLDQLLAFASVAPEFTNDNVGFGSLLPYLYPDYAPDGAWIYSGDWSQIPGFVQGYLTGTISQ